MKILLLPALLFCAFSVTAQTKLISHKSHSGNLSTFETAIRENLWDISSSNIGLPDITPVIARTLDSVIYISPEKTLLVQSVYKKEVYTDNSKTFRTFPKETERDTVFKHPLFSRNHSLDSIKRILSKGYGFQNDSVQTFYQGFDNKKRMYKKEGRNKKSFPILAINNSDDGNFPPKIFFFAILFILFSLAYFLLGKKIGPFWFGAQK
jgi:hypothetical protein